MKTYNIINLKGVRENQIKGTKILSQNNGITFAVYNENEIVALIQADKVTGIVEQESCP